MRFARGLAAISLVYEPPRTRDDAFAPPLGAFAPRSDAFAPRSAPFPGVHFDF
jgi:hypothetical protein